MGRFRWSRTLSVLRLGILFSTAGDTAALGRDCRDGALLALDELRAEQGSALAIEPVIGDPGGVGDRYIALARRMLTEDGCRHIVGTVTSQSRKDVIPVVEKHDATLWYVCPYEGFEANPNVVYTGGCPNQHLVPLFAHMLPAYGRRVFLAGANYVWGWEMNRLAREIVTEAGGSIVGERCLPIAETDVAGLVAAVEARRPDFVLSNMLGPANHAFLRAMRDLGRRDPAFRPKRCPVVSCDLTEAELPEIGAGVADGQLAAAAFFECLDTSQARRLKARAAARFGATRRVSSYFATGYATVRLLGEAALRCGTDDPTRLRAALDGPETEGPLGPLRIDPATNHAALPFWLGRIAGDGFEVIGSGPRRAADPYLTGPRPLVPEAGRPRLRVVS
ncbi:transporter substrate-binding protein [Lichenihabitans sp. Uapishka_5]|uniref:transporter substrate-binding protein n=1 Tax=Lichenihabitans sp. Uapishka_5 TaxID=3037302 RepID=UPI0029E81A81|nr:transporter substrate-binding protein [Lichenihabitans sp. Uapishka_5]MDX7950596.1 transporter substrate-binding protein [Lichenihabitans sp. Uapishka_5]